MLIGHKCSIIILPSILPASLSASILVPNTGNSKIKYQSFKSSRLHLYGVELFWVPEGQHVLPIFRLCCYFLFIFILCLYESRAGLPSWDLTYPAASPTRAGTKSFIHVTKFVFVRFFQHINNSQVLLVHVQKMSSCLTRIDKLCNFSYKHNKNYRYCFDICFINGVLNMFNFTRVV